MVPGPASPAIETVVSPKGDRLATIEQEGSKEVLYLQSADGSNRTRVHFQNVSDHVDGNYPSTLVPVTDESILAIRRAKWSPDGQSIAVIVVPRIDVAEVVLVAADGHALRTVSRNSQYLFGDVDWSPDSRRIAYAMTTGPLTRPDLFVTDLGPDRVTRVTTGGMLSGFDTFRFDPTGQRINFTSRLGFADDDVNGLFRLASVDVTTGVVVGKETMVGEPQGITRDGSWALLIRRTADNMRQLVRVSLPAGAETVLTGGDISNAVLLEGDREALVASPDPNDRNGLAQTFQIFGVDAPKDVRATLPTGTNVNWAAFLHLSR
jgi:dipeptidyl aminopeptidase/acylaminoacyl peptidase